MEPQAITDGELVRQTLRGDPKAFDELIRRYQRQAVAVSYRLLGNSQDAMEITQDAYLKAYSGLSGLQKPEAFGGWLMRIVSNLSLNQRRSRKTRKQQPLDEAIVSGEVASDGFGGQGTSPSGDPARRLQSAELGEQLKEALAELPEKQRLAITLFTLEQMPQKQVADILECSVEAVKWHVFQGRKKLKDVLKDYL